MNKEDGSSVRVDHYLDKVLKLKSVVGSQRSCVLTKVIKCPVSLSHGNADNEKSLSVNKKSWSKERTSLSITTLNGLRGTEDGIRNMDEDSIRNMDGLSNVNVSKNVLSSVKDSHKASLEHLDIEQKKQDSHREKKLIASEGKVKKMQKKIEVKLKASRQRTPDTHMVP